VRHSINAVVMTLFEAILLVVIVVILFLQTWRASIIPLAAVPVVRLAHRRGVLTSLLACALTIAIVLGLGWATGGVGSGVAMALLAAAITVLPVASVGFLRAGAEPSRCYLGLCIAGSAFLVASLATQLEGNGATAGDQLAALLNGVIPSSVDSYAKTGAKPEMIAEFRAMLEATREFTRNYLWGLLGVLWVIGSAIAFFGGAASARPNATADAVRFDQLRVPPAAAGLFVASGAGLAVLSGEARRIAGNVLLPLLALYFVAGLSIICHFLRKWFRARFLRAGLYALVCYFPINVGVALLGLFDWYVDFRRRGGGVTEKS